MSDELDERKDRMWKMEEVRSGDTDVEDSDAPDTPDTTDAPDIPDTPGNQDSLNTEDGIDTTGATGTPDASDTEDTSDRSDMNGDLLPPDATIRELFLAAQDQELTVGDLRNVNVYLFDQVHTEMNNLLAEVNYRAMKQRGQEVQMNKEFFNAIYRVAAQHEDEVLSELELEQ
jgi:hypothetical protein